MVEKVLDVPLCMCTVYILQRYIYHSRLVRRAHGYIDVVVLSPLHTYGNVQLTCIIMKDRQIDDSQRVVDVMACVTHRLRQR